MTGNDKLKKLIKEAVRETLNEMDWGSDKLHSIKDIKKWASDSHDRLMVIANLSINDRNNNLEPHHRAQLLAMAAKIDQAVDKAYRLGFDAGEDDYRKRI